MNWKSMIACLVMAGISILPAASASADIYRYRDEERIWHFTNIKSDKRYQIYIPESKENPAEFIIKYGPIIEQASDRFRLDPSLVKAVIKAESDFDHRATSHRGAQGLMQLMPDTAVEMEVNNPYNPEENIFGGARYLSRLLQRFKNDMTLALAAYNAGPEKVEIYEGVPPYTETKNFIKRVLDFYEQYKSEASLP